MIDLYINDKPCVLGSVSFEVNITNPLVNDKNNHTLDITLKLTDNINSKIFSFKNRFDKAIKNDVTYKGDIRYNGQKIISGDINILDVTNEDIKIQIVENTHFFRYSDADDTRYYGGYRIDKLPLGTLDFTDNAKPSERESITYKNAICIPTLTEFKDSAYQKLNDDEELYMLNDFASSGDKNIAPHPYLLKTIEAIFRALNFNVTYNCLMESELAKRIVIISSTLGNLWAKHLPAWTVAKFVTEFEKFFNVEVRINYTLRSVEIVSRKLFVTRNIDIEAFDDYSVEIKDVGSGLNFYENVRYNFPDDLYYKEADISEEQLEKFTVRKTEKQTIPTNSIFQPTMFQIVEDGKERNEYFCRYDKYDYDAYLTPVMNYQHLGIYDADNVTTLDIIPCMHCCFYPREISTLPSGREYIYDYAPIPVAKNYDIPEEIVQNDSYSIINDGVKEMPNNNDDKLYIAIYGGWTKAFTNSDGVEIVKSQWPYIMIPFTINNVTHRLTALYGATQPYYTNLNLSLKRIQQEFYYNDLIDTTNLYKVKAKIAFYKQIDNIKFVIKNKSFIVDNIKYKFSDTGLEPEAELELYPLKEQS